MATEANQGSAGEPTGHEGTPPPVVGGQPSPVGQVVAGAADAASAAGAPAEGDKPKPADFKGGEQAWLERIAQAKRTAAAKAEADHKAWLKSKFGTDDPAEAEKKIAALGKLEADEEKRRRNAMSEQEKLQTDLAREKEARVKAEARAKEAEASWQHEKQSSTIERLASGHIAPEYVEDVVHAVFARHVKSLPKDEAEALTEKDVAKWFADFAKRKPAFAATQEQKQAAAAPRRQPVGTSGAPAQPPPAPNAGPAGKVMHPGRPNSMTDQEAKAALRKQGLHY